MSLVNSPIARKIGLVQLAAVCNAAPKHHSICGLGVHVVSLVVGKTSGDPQISKHTLYGVNLAYWHFVR